MTDFLDTCSPSAPSSQRSATTRDTFVAVADAGDRPTAVAVIIANDLVDAELELEPEAPLFLSPSSFAWIRSVSSLYLQVVSKPRMGGVLLVSILMPMP
jgi:hypothetical protein